MLTFLCIIALCGLFSPSQGDQHEAVVQVILCNNTIGRFITELLDTDGLSSMIPLGKVIPLGSLLGQKKGNSKGNILGGVPLGGLLSGTLNTVTGIAGLTITDASLAKAGVKLLPEKIVLHLTIGLGAELNLVAATNLLEVLPLDIRKTLGDGPLCLSVGLATQAPLMYSKSEKHPIKLTLDQKNCKALQLSIKIKSCSGGSGALSSVTGLLEGTLGGTLTDSIGGIISPLVCDSVLPTVLSLLNGKLYLLGGLFPVGDIGNIVEYTIKGVRQVVGDCLQMDVNAASDGDLIGISDGSDEPQLPSIVSDGVVMSFAFINKFFQLQLTGKVWNSMMMKAKRIRISSDEVQAMFPEAAENEFWGLAMKIRVDGDPIISFEEGHVTVNVTAEMGAYDEKSRLPVFKLRLDTLLSVILSIEGQNLVPALSLRSVENIQVLSSSFNISVKVIQGFIESSISTNMVDVIKNLKITIPIPYSGSNPKDYEIRFKEKAVVIFS